MGKWEFLFLRGSTGNGGPHPAYVNGEEVRDPRVYRLSVYEYANALGEEGWEIISSDVEGKRVVFKRGKPESP